MLVLFYLILTSVGDEQATAQRDECIIDPMSPQCLGSPTNIGLLFKSDDYDDYEAALELRTHAGPVHPADALARTGDFRAIMREFIEADEIDPRPCYCGVYEVPTESGKRGDTT